MASGSSGRPSSGSKGFDFGSDDILCDYGDQEVANGTIHSDPVTVAGSSKFEQDFNKSRMTRSSVYGAPVYGQPSNQEVISTVEKSMEKYTDNLMRFLEGISSRLSQLELYCYNLDKSIAEIRSDLTRDHGEADTKLKSLDKSLQEVHRSVQILRDKQELAETQKELAKLQLVQKEPASSSTHSQSNEDKASTPTSDLKRNDNASETQNRQLALVLPQQQSVTPPPAQNVNQQQSYYLPQTQYSTPQVPVLVPQSQYMSPDTQYRASHLQDPTRVAPQPMQPNQPQASQPFPQYHQQWSQQVPPQQLQPQIRPPPTYPPYPPNQPTNPPPPETLPNSMPMQMPYPGNPQPGPTRADTVPYGYGSAGRATVQQSPPQQMKGAYGAQPGDGYAPDGPHPTLPPGSTYMIYDSEGARTHHPHFQQGGYPPSSVPRQSSQPNSGTIAQTPSHPQFVRNHPYNELIEKLAIMGFRGDHVMTVIQRMEESGQPVDFNAVLDRLSVVHPSAAPQRGWSG